MQQEKKNTGRLAFIDWMRGVAAVVMLQGHTFHSFTRSDLRDKGPYMLSQFVGGLPPAMFLFLTGITFAFLMDSQDRKGLSAGRKVWAACLRSRYLFFIAFLFRFQLYVFGFPTSPAIELLRVDILNCMGMSMLLLAPMAIFSTAERIRYCSVVGLVIAFLAPVVAQVDVSWMPTFLSSYFVPTFTGFGFFPWAAFLAFGMVAGSVIRTVPQDRLGMAMMWMLGVGLSTVIAAHQLSLLPYSLYPKVDYWLASPGLTTIKLGIVLIILAISFLWVSYSPEVRWSLFRQLGTTSLLVYWVHIELVYGRWFGVWKEKLSFPYVVLYTVVLIALMTVLSVGKTSGFLLPYLTRTQPIPARDPVS
jgi:uncharacterized membrane protein